MDKGIDEGSYRDMFIICSKEASDVLFEEESFAPLWDNVKVQRKQHSYFHWPLEFPDVFQGHDGEGYSAVVGNPPWDVLQPNSQEFYETYDPSFRKYSKQEALTKIKRLHHSNPEIKSRWEAFKRSFSEVAGYCKEPSIYLSLTKGKIDLYKAFSERFLQLLSNNGRIGIVLPSGIYTDQGCQPLREMFFSKSRINCLYCFENRWPTVFPAVDGRFKFVLFCTEKGGITESFKCAFMEHNPERLPLIDKNALVMTLKQVKRFSPELLTPLELDSSESLKIIEKCYDKSILISKEKKIEIYQELNITSNSDLLNTIENGFPLFEGKNIRQYDSKWEPPKYWISKEKAVNFIQKKYKNNNHKDYNYHRLCFRGIARTTDERTLISSIIPKLSLCEVKCTCIDYLDELNREALLLAILSLLNSFVIDFNIRFRVSANVNIFHIEQLPIKLHLPTVKNELIARAARLLCFDERLNKLWEDIFTSHVSIFSNPDFWYPQYSSGNSLIDTYGPREEQEIRINLAESVKSLTPEWGPHCGVHDRTHDRRDRGDRAQLRAEIDAYVAHLYGLSREDFSYILDTFPVLKRKEIAAFGEYMSKRKCLEEYDRLNIVLNMDNKE